MLIGILRQLLPSGESKYANACSKFKEEPTKVLLSYIFGRRYGFLWTPTVLKCFSKVWHFGAWLISKIM